MDPNETRRPGRDPDETLLGLKSLIVLKIDPDEARKRPGQGSDEARMKPY